jgi:hypothetical protein
LRFPHPRRQAQDNQTAKPHQLFREDEKTVSMKEFLSDDHRGLHGIFDIQEASDDGAEF